MENENYATMMRNLATIKIELKKLLLDLSQATADAKTTPRTEKPEEHYRRLVAKLMDLRIKTNGIAAMFEQTSECADKFADDIEFGE